MLFFRKSREAAPAKRPPIRAELAALVRTHMQGADDEDVRIAAAIAGLFATVAYADRDFSDAERSRIREDLLRMHTLPRTGVDAVCSLLEARIAELAAGNSQAFTRDLRELLDADSRRELLAVLVDLAASDGEIAYAESELLRRVTNALALTPEDYLAAQSVYRERLALLQD